MQQRARRRILVALGAALAAPWAVNAQGPSRVRRIGVLGLWRANPEFQKWLSGELRSVGYEEGRNLAIEWRWADGQVDSLTALAADLVNRGVELIVAVLNDEILAAKKATRTIPIVMLYASAPVEAGLVESLARPGGNVTGTTWFGPETAQKLLQVLKEARPGARNVAVLANPRFPGMKAYRAEIDRVAPGIGIQLTYFEATRGEQVPDALGRIAASRPDALYFAEDPVLSVRMGEIAAFATRHKLVSIGTNDAWTRMGGLFVYMPNQEQLTRRFVTYVDRILRGTKPADLPVEQPTHYELVINLKAAKAIGFQVPAALLARADRTIE